MSLRDKHSQRTSLLNFSGECGEGFGGVAVGFYVGPDFFDFAVFADQEGDAVDAHVFSAHEGFFAPDVVGVDDFLLVVDEEREWEVEFFGEFFVAFGGVGTDAEDDGAFFLKFIVPIAEAARFLGATGGVVPGIKIKDDVFAAEIGKSNGVAGKSGGFEIGGGVALLEPQFDFLFHLASVKNSALSRWQSSPMEGLKVVARPHDSLLYRVA